MSDENDMSFDDLEAMFSQDDSEISRMENVVLSQNLDGFAQCFPDWDIHPPVKL
ncbi:MAG: hypothetical protein K5888_07425 [Lachnospiraceae bacterium]|nr:hypothetical protein [Lachnospiraceae bacterium]